MNIHHINYESDDSTPAPEKVTAGDRTIGFLHKYHINVLSDSERECQKREWASFFQQAVRQSKAKMRKTNAIKAEKHKIEMRNLMTPGAVRDVVAAGKQESNYQPICQIIHIKEITTNPGQANRFRIVISDGDCYILGMLVTLLNPMINNHELKIHSIVRIKKFVIKEVDGMNLMVVLGIDVLDNSVKEKVGNHEIREVNSN